MRSGWVRPSAWPVSQAGRRGGVQAAGVTVADGGEGEGVGDLAGDGGGEAGAGVGGDGDGDGDGAVVGEVAAAALGAVGE